MIDRVYPHRCTKCDKIMAIDVKKLPEEEVPGLPLTRRTMGWNECLLYVQGIIVEIDND